MSEPKVNLQGGGRTDNFGRLNAIYVNIKRMFGIPTGTAEYLLGLDENQNLVKTVDGGGGGAGLVDGDYGDVVVSGVGTVMTIDDLAVTTAKIADNAVELGKIQEIGQHKLIGRHSAGDGIPHQIGVTNGIEFTGQDIGIADSGVTQAKLDATGAAAGKVLTTDGTAMTWETPAGGGLTLPIDETVGVYSNEAAIVLTLENPSLGFTTFPKGVTLDIVGFTGDATGRGVGLEITGANGQSSGGDCYSLAIKSGDPISTTHILNTEQNYLTIDSSHVRIGGVYEWYEGYAGQSSFAITGSLNIDINNPSIPIGDGSVTETKLGDSSVTQAKISATGADVGKVLTTDGTTMTWETPNAVPTGTAENTTRFNASGQLVETNVIAISDAADVYVTGNTFDVILNTGGSEIYMDGTSAYLSLENGDNLDGGGLILSKPGGPNLTYGLDAADSIWTQSVTYLVKLDANTYTGNGSILVGEYDVAEDVPKWGFRNIADSFPVGTPAFNLLNTSSAPFATSKSYIDLIYTTYSKYTKLSANYFCLDLMPNFYNFTASYGGTSRSIIGFANNQMQTMPNLGFWIDTWNSSLGFVSKTMPSWMPNYFPGNAQTTNTRMSVDANTGRSIVMAAYADESAFTGYMYNNNDGTGWKAVYKTIDGSTSDRYGVINRVYVSGSNYLLYIHTSGGTKWFRTTNHITYTEIVGLTGGIMYETSQAGHLICYNVGATVWWYSANNGTTWTAGTTLPVTVSDGRNAIDFNGTQFVYASGTTANQVYYTTAVNGSWTTRAAGGATLQNTPDMVYWLNDRWIFLITGQSDTTTYGGYSTDIASNYSVGSVPSPGSNQFFWACYGGGSWYIITNNAYYHSADGINYTRVATTLVPTSPSMQHDVKKTHIYQQNDILTTAPYTTSSLIRLNLTTRVVSTIAANAQLTNCVQMADSTYTIGSKNLWVKYAM